MNESKSKKGLWLSWSDGLICYSNSWVINGSLVRMASRVDHEGDLSSLRRVKKRKGLFSGSHIPVLFRLKFENWKCSYFGCGDSGVIQLFSGRFWFRSKVQNGKHQSWIARPFFPSLILFTRFDFPFLLFISPFRWTVILGMKEDLMNERKRKERFSLLWICE